MRISTAFLATAAAAWLASAAVAQTPGGGRGRGGMMGGMFGGGNLATNPSVQEELKLTDDQKAKLKTFSDEQSAKRREAMQKARDDAGGGGGFDRDAFTKMAKDAAEASDKAMKEILTADQQKRFQQIKWQAMKVAAFVDPELQKTLKFSDDQKTKLKGIADDVAKDVQELMRDAQGNFEGIREKADGLTKEAQTNAEKVLTDDQKKEWKAALGTAFEVKPDPNARQGGPGGPGGGGENKDAKGTRPKRGTKGGDKADEKKTDPTKKDAPKKPKIDD